MFELLLFNVTQTTHALFEHYAGTLMGGYLSAKLPETYSICNSLFLYCF